MVGWGTIIQSLFQQLPHVLYGVQVRGHCWPHQMRLSHILKSSCDNSGSIRWRIIIHKQKVWGVLVELDGVEGFYGVSEVRTYSDWAIYKNQFGFVLTGVACSDCFTYSTKANPCPSCRRTQHLTEGKQGLRH